ncbi:hypothetical protein DY000_02058971 [Brassica cretica]|uniref:Uncharacterized protein n=1 Tax=Brassica cretica TaxID=69181 RepID=A0ABQ7B061_BRACR|nr:hypothetical protein DY000_02058971 [Brassica cretica]
MLVERCRGFDKRVSFFFLSFVSSSLLRERRFEWRLSPRWLASTKGDGSICGSRRGRETKTFLSVALLEATSGDLSLYRWLSETKNNGDCCGGGESKGGLIKTHDPRRFVPSSSTIYDLMKTHHTGSSDNGRHGLHTGKASVFAMIRNKSCGVLIVLDKCLLRQLACDQCFTMWTIKQEDLAVKERLSKMKVLDSLIGKKEHLPDLLFCFMFKFDLLLPGHETGATEGHEWRQCCVVMQVTSGDSDGCHETGATEGHEWRQCCVVMQVTSGDSDGCCRVETMLCLVVSCCFVVVESAVL